MNQTRVGIFISYVNLLLGMVVNLFFTPMLIGALGDVDYSLYKVMQSFAGPLSMFHLGISAIVTRSIVKYQTLDDFSENEKRNTFAHALLASGMMSFFIAAAGVIMCAMIPSVYGKIYDAEHVQTGQIIFMIFVVSTVFHMMTDAFSGCIIGHERFTVSSSIQLSRNLLKILLLFVLLNIGVGVVAVVCIDLVISFTIFILSVAYSMGKLREFPKLSHFDKRLMMDIVMFGSAILLQAVVNQVNNNVDTMILGASVSDKSIITMYSSALAIYAVYNSLISVITNFFLPKATKLVVQDVSGAELTDFVIKPGRFQAVIAVGAVCGFALFGWNFITIWIGERYIEAYWITLLLLIPVTVPLVENAAIAILDATLKRMYRSIVLVIMAGINVVLTIILIAYIGFWGAAVGTVISLIVGHGILMNVYYAKTFHMQIGRMFFSIFKGILPAGLAASAVCIPLMLFVPNTILFFIIKCVCFLLVYAVLLWLFGMNDEEKQVVGGIPRKLFCRKGSSKTIRNGE